jgi:phosphotriesterase-related protein
MYVQTVNGKVAPESLGITLSHEHLFMDFRAGWIRPPDSYAYLTGAEVDAGTARDLARNPQYSLANLVLDDEPAALAELLKFKTFGGNTVVDVTSCGLGPEPLKLRHVSLQSGVNIVAGCGHYRQKTQNPGTLSMKSEQLLEEILKSLQVGIGLTDVKAGIIGEIGTSVPLHPFERESLMAAAGAQKKTGVALSLHPDIWEFGQLDVLDILEGAGADLNRIVVSHVDEVVDTDWHGRIARRGVYLGFDTFGSEFSYDGIDEPRDSDRITSLLALLDKGYIDRLLLSQDICYKIQLEKYGGKGYSHILSSIVPRLRELGVSRAEINKMLVDNPRRLLGISS